MNRRAALALRFFALAVAVYLGGLWAINEFFIKDDRSADLKAEFVLETRLSGQGDTRLSRKFLRDLGSSRDASILSLLRMLGEKGLKDPGAPPAAEDTMPLADLLAFRAKTLNRNSLAARMVQVDPDSSRFLVPIYRGYVEAGLLMELKGDSLIRSRLKSLGKGLHRHDMPFQAVEVFRACQLIQGQGQDDPELTAWLGGAMTKRALFVESSLDKIKMVKEGVKLLDKAAFEHPDFGVVRYIRANTYSSLPPVFRKSSLLKSDIQFLMAQKASGKAVKIWAGEGRVVEAPVNREQLKLILEKSYPIFSEDADFRSRMQTALREMEN